MHHIADLHLHSKYSRAVSPKMIPPEIAAWGYKKGIDIVTTSDWTHPLWFKEITTQLEEASEGLYKLKKQYETVGLKKAREIAASYTAVKELRFLLTVEVAIIYSQGGKGRRIHALIFAPNLEAAEKINKALLKRGANLVSDGRPMLGITASDLVKLIMEADDKAFLIPAHIWTPWYGAYGSKSGFDSLKDAFLDQVKYIYGIETGLSSDPAMNWQIPELINRSILSFSDAHSLMKMGREATIFDIPKEIEHVTYSDLRDAIMRKNNGNRIAYTIEFYPEEGKYHYTGHRNCSVVYSPQDTAKKGTTCPVCKRPLTVGVMERVENLSTPRVKNQDIKLNDYGLKWITDTNKKRPPYINLVPLIEIIAESLEVTVLSPKALDFYEKMLENFGTEFEILLKTPIEELLKVGGEKVAQAVDQVRRGTLTIRPGYDGEYGLVKIWD